MRYITIGSDHRGHALKNIISKHFAEYGYPIHDVGTFNEQRCDYNDYAIKVCKDVKNNINCIGILICGSGIGMSIAANRIPGIRCVLATNENTARLGRWHNDANVIALSSDTHDPIAIISTFIHAKFINQPIYINRNLKLDKKIEI